MSGHREWLVGEWRVHPTLNRISRGDETVSLPTKFMDLLVCLAENRGKVMSKEEITLAVWRRDFISDGTLSHAVAQVRQALGDDTHEARYIETIPTRGYRLIASAEPLDDNTDQDAVPVPGIVAGLNRRRLLALSAVAVVAVAVALVGLVVRAGHAVGRTKTAAVRFGGRMAILPFDNLGPADRSYLAAGLTDDLTSRLASIAELGVISRMSASSVDTAGKTARAIGGELGVDYLLAGTVRWELDASGGGVVRVNAQLVRTTDDSHLWVGSFGSPVGQLFEVEAEIAENVLARIGVRVAEGVRQRLRERPTADPDALEAYLSGLRHSRIDTPAHIGLAGAMFRRATELDPKFALAWAGLGEVQARGLDQWSGPDPTTLAGARAAIDRAVALDPELPEAQRALGAYLLYGERDLARASEALQRAVVGLPNDSDLRVLIAEVDRRQGRWDAARTGLEAVYVSDPRNYAVAVALGDTFASRRRWGAADIAYRRAASVLPDASQPHQRRAWNLLRWEGPSERTRAALTQLPDPGDPSLAFTRFFVAYVERDFDEARAVLRKTSDARVATPTMWVPRALLECLALVAAGRRDEAGQSCSAVLEAGPDDSRVAGDPGLHIVRAYALAVLGRDAAAAGEIKQALAMCPLGDDAVRGSDCLFESARVYALLGDADRAMEAVETLLAMPSQESVALLTADPRFDRIRGDRRFRALLRPNLGS